MPKIQVRHRVKLYYHTRDWTLEAADVSPDWFSVSVGLGVGVGLGLGVGLRLGVGFRLGVGVGLGWG